MLDRSNKKVAGVCAGFARYYGEDVTLVRVVWLAVALATGIGFLAYIAAWMVMPSDHGIQYQGARAPQAEAT
jgi:phage shock protein PspC (stress-responsive transcriptional regulator)